MARNLAYVSVSDGEIMSLASKQQENVMYEGVTYEISISLCMCHICNGVMSYVAARLLGISYVS